MGLPFWLLPPTLPGVAVGVVAGAALRGVLGLRRSARKGKLAVDRAAKRRQSTLLGSSGGSTPAPSPGDVCGSGGLRSARGAPQHAGQAASTSSGSLQWEMAWERGVRENDSLGGADPAAQQWTMADLQGALAGLSPQELWKLKALVSSAPDPESLRLALERVKADSDPPGAAAAAHGAAVPEPFTAVAGVQLGEGPDGGCDGMELDDLALEIPPDDVGDASSFYLQSDELQFLAELGGKAPPQPALSGSTTDTQASDDSLGCGAADQAQSAGLGLGPAPPQAQQQMHPVPFQVSAELDGLIRRMMVRHPGSSYQDVFRQVLQQYPQMAAHIAVAATPPPPPQPASEAEQEAALYGSLPPALRAFVDKCCARHPEATRLQVMQEVVQQQRAHGGPAGV